MQHYSYLQTTLFNNDKTHRGHIVDLSSNGQLKSLKQKGVRLKKIKFQRKIQFRVNIFSLNCLTNKHSNGDHIVVTIRIINNRLISMYLTIKKKSKA